MQPKRRVLCAESRLITQGLAIGTRDTIKRQGAYDQRDVIAHVRKLDLCSDKNAQTAKIFAKARMGEAR